MNGWRSRYRETVTLGAMSRPATIGDRLREILTEIGISQREAAERAGVDPSTINDIVQNRRPRVSADLLKRILDGIGVPIGRFYKEPSLELTDRHAQLAEEFRHFLGEFIAADAAVKAARRQQATVGEKKTSRGGRRVERSRAAGRHEPVSDVRNLPNETIPPEYYRRGARLAYQVDSDSMIGAGIYDGSLLYVRPTLDRAAADGQIVICLLNGAEYVKRLDLRGGQVHLHSENPRYPAMPVDEEEDTFRLVGVVLL